MNNSDRPTMIIVYRYLLGLPNDEYKAPKMAIAKIFRFSRNNMMLSVWQLREDSQIDFSTHNVKWTLSPDPPAPFA